MSVFGCRLVCLLIFKRTWTVFRRCWKWNNLFVNLWMMKLFFVSIIKVHSQKRKWTPKVVNEMETVCNEFSIPQNRDDFRVHHRVSRHLFEMLLQEIYDTFFYEEQVREKPHIHTNNNRYTLWYLSNIASMPEVKHIFDMSNSIVHAVFSASILCFLKTTTQGKWFYIDQNIHLSTKIHFG